MDVLTIAAVTSWGVGPLALFVCFIEDVSLPGDTPHARSAVAVLLTVFAPIVLPSLLLVAIGAGVRYIAIGFRDLYRQFVPRRVKLPVAKVRR